MRLFAITVIGVVVAVRSGWPVSPSDNLGVGAQEAAANKGPQVEEILIPIYAKPRPRLDAGSSAYWGSLGDGEVFREIRTLSREGLVQNAGQPAAPLRILREFFAPTSLLEQQRDGFLGHYVFIVECTKSDLKHVMGLVTKER